MRRRLFAWIYPPYLITALVCTLAFTAFTARVASSFFLDLSALELHQTARVVASAIRPAFKGGGLSGEQALRALCDELAAGTELRISVIALDGRVIADTKEVPESMENHLGRREVEEALRGGRGSAVRVSASTGIETVYEAIALRGPEGEALAIVRSAMPFSIIGSRRRELIASVLGFSLFAALLLSGIALILAKRIADPIGRLERGASAFAAGMLETRLAVTGPREIAGLASVMNGMARELGERMEVIREQKRRIEAVLNGMSEAVVVMEPGLRVLATNPAFRRLFGNDAPLGGIAGLNDDLEGPGLLELTENPELCTFAEAALHAKGPLETVLSLYTDGTKRLRIASSPLEGGRAVLVINDLTRMDRLETIRRDFTANVSHELKTPITSIRGALETLEAEAEEGKLPEDSARFVAMALRNADRLEAILADLLSLARIEEGESRGIEKADLELDRLMDEVLSDAGVRLQAAGIVLRREGEGGIRFRAHEGLLKQALANLLDNAIKYAAQGGRIELLTARQGASVKLSVIDHGPGIPERDRSRIFERFYRIDKARSREAGGTGLGLAIVRHVALAHGGTACVESEVGRGSTFSIILPAG